MIVLNFYSQVTWAGAQVQGVSQDRPHPEGIITREEEMALSGINILQFLKPPCKTDWRWMIAHWWVDFYQAPDYLIIYTF